MNATPDIRWQDLDEKTTSAISWDYVLMIDSQDSNELKLMNWDLFRWDKWDKWDKWDAGDLSSLVGWNKITIDITTPSTPVVNFDGLSWWEITGKPSTFTPSSHNHTISEITWLQSALDGKANSSHAHVISSISWLQTALDSKASLSHTHTISQITGLQSELDSKANSSHTHIISDITGLQSELDSKIEASDITGKANLSWGNNFSWDQNFDGDVTLQSGHYIRVLDWSTNYGELKWVNLSFYRVNNPAYVNNKWLGGSLRFRVSDISELDTTAMTIVRDGKVWIGTITPDTALHISTSWSSIATFQTSTTWDGAIEIRNSQWSVFYGIDGSENFSVWNGVDLNGVNNIFTVDMSTSNVGVWISNPLSRLHVYQNDVEVWVGWWLTIEQDGTWDAMLQFLLTWTRRWFHYIDNSDWDKYKIGTGTYWTSVVTIDTGWRMWVWTTTPYEKLEIDSWSMVIDAFWTEWTWLFFRRAFSPNWTSSTSKYNMSITSKDFSWANADGWVISFFDGIALHTWSSTYNESKVWLFVSSTQMVWVWTINPDSKLHIESQSATSLKIDGIWTANTLVRFMDDGTETGAIYTLNWSTDMNIRAVWRVQLISNSWATSLRVETNWSLTAPNMTVTEITDDQHLATKRYVDNNWYSAFFAQRIYCYTDLRWISLFDDNYGANTENASEPAWTWTEPIVEWENKWMMLFPGERIDKLTIQLRNTNTEVSDFEIRLILKTPTAWHEYEKREIAVDSDYTQEVLFAWNYTEASMLWSSNRMSRKTIPLSKNITDDCELVLLMKPIWTLTATRYTQASFRYDISKA